MKMNKKGFTLIELLAVIVILAIIALIATPMILGVIDKAKKGAAESSALGYIDAVEKYSVIGMLDAEAGSATTALTSGVYEVSTLNSKVDLKGKAPSEGWVAINDEGLIVASVLKFDSYASKLVGYTDTKNAKATIATDADVATKPEIGEGKTYADMDAVVTAVNTAIGD